MAFALPSLPYDYKALEPTIDEQTMRLHHDKHHAAYVNNLNAALEPHPDLQKKSIEELLTSLDKVPEGIRTKVRNNGGGHANHTIFWEMMAPGGAKEPSGALADALNKAFGSVATFKEQFVKACVERFGSGWGWLTADRSGKLVIESTPNQDHRAQIDASSSNTASASAKICSDASPNTASRPISSITGTASGETRSSALWMIRPLMRASMVPRRRMSSKPVAASARPARRSTWSG